MYIHTCLHAYTFIYTILDIMYNVCMCVCKYAYIDFPKISLLERGYHIYIYIYMYIYTYSRYVYIYIYICVCVYL